MAQVGPGRCGRLGDGHRVLLRGDGGRAVGRRLVGAVAENSAAPRDPGSRGGVPFCVPEIVPVGSGHQTRDDGTPALAHWRGDRCSRPARPRPSAPACARTGGAPSWRARRGGAGCLLVAVPGVALVVVAACVVLDAQADRRRSARSTWPSAAWSAGHRRARGAVRRGDPGLPPAARGGPGARGTGAFWAVDGLCESYAVVGLHAQPPSFRSAGSPTGSFAEAGSFLLVALPLLLVLYPTGRLPDWSLAAGRPSAALVMSLALPLSLVLAPDSAIYGEAAARRRWCGCFPQLALPLSPTASRPIRVGPGAHDAGDAARRRGRLRPARARDRASSGPSCAGCSGPRSSACSRAG